MAFDTPTAAHPKPPAASPPSPLPALSASPVAAGIVDRVRAAAGAGTLLRIRGAGSKDFYGGPPVGEVLDLRELSGITSYEPSELVVTARAGTPLAELDALLAAQGQCLPFEPPHFSGGAGGHTGGTVGGMVASGLSGPARASVGAVRDYVLGVVMVNGKAELLTFGGQVMKNVAGYDVSRLMVGAMGTLGVLLEISLKVLPVAPAEATLVFDFDEATALRQLNGWGALPLPVNASYWEGGRLWVRLRGAVAAVAAARKLMGGEAMPDRGADATQALWTGLRDQSAAYFQLQPGDALWRVGVPDVAPPLALGPTLLEWGGAQRWLKRPASDAAAIRTAARAARGHATLFRCLDKTVPVFTPLAAPLQRISRELKRQFDPAGIFNPGRLNPDF